MMKRLFLLSLLGLLVSCAPSLPHPDQLVFPPLTLQIPAIDRMELPNGIRLYLREDHELPLVQVTAMLGSGSIADPAALTGRGGLYAAVLRSGGAGDRTPEAFDAMVEALAANLLVGVDSYATSLDLSLQSADLSAGLHLLSDLLRRPRFAPERLELARKQAIEGVRRQDDDPGSIAQRALMAALYGEHPLGRTPTVASLSAIGRDDLLAFHRQAAHPDNLWLAISGDFDRAALLAQLEQLFGDWPRGNQPPQVLPPVTAKPRPVVLLAEKEIPQTTILLGELGIAKDAPDLHSVRVMNFILGGGGFNSRLMREIRSDRGLAYSVYSHFQVGRRLPGAFFAGAETKSESTLEVVGLIRQQMEALRETPVSAAELALAKESLVNSFVFAFTDTHDVVTQQVRLDYYGYPADYLQRYQQQVAAVSAEQVQQAARERLDLTRQTLVLVGNPSQFDAPPESLGLPVEPILKRD